MGVRKLKTTVVEHDEQEVSIRALEVLPDLLQVRANLDKGWSLQYSKDYAKGDPFPPILVYRLPDERLVVTDGFHRIDACLAIGKKTIRAQIREGTIQEALLAAIEANTAAFHRGRPFGKEDRRHAIEMLFADPECWKWANKRIADCCGVSQSTVKIHRLEYARRVKIELPTVAIASNGKRRPLHNNANIVITETKHPNTSTGVRYIKHIDGKTVHLGIDREEAQKRLEAIIAARESKRQSLDVSAVKGWLACRKLVFRSIIVQNRNYLTGWFGHGVVFVISKFDGDRDVVNAVGSLCLLRQYLEKENPNPRLVVVCYPEDGPAELIDLARQDGIEFLTPDELVESLRS